MPKSLTAIITGLLAAFTLVVPATRITYAEIIEFYLVDADTGEDIQKLRPDAQSLNLPLQNFANRNSTVRAVTNSRTGPIRSVFLQLEGPIRAQRRERGAPYAVFPNTTTHYTGRRLVEGSYTITATNFPCFDGNCAPYSTQTARFTLTDQPDTAPARITGLQFIDTDSNNPIPSLDDLSDGAIADFALIKNKFVTVEILTEDPANLTRRVEMSLNGPVGHEQIELGAPWTLFGNERSDYAGKHFAPGEYRLAIRIYPCATGSCEALDELVTRFTFQETTQPAQPQINLDWVSVDTNGRPMLREEVADVQAIEADPATGLRHTIEARINDDGDELKAFLYQINGPLTHQQTERQFPYVLFGDSGTDNLEARHFTPGNYQVTVQAYPCADLNCQPTAQRNVVIQVSEPEDDHPLRLYWTVFSNQGDILQRTDMPAFFTFDLNTYTDARYTIEAVIEDPHFSAGSMKFDLSGPFSWQSTEYLYPFALFGDDGPNQLQARLLPNGDYELTVFGYSCQDAQCESERERTVRFQLTGGSSQTPTEHVDADYFHQNGEALVREECRGPLAVENHRAVPECSDIGVPSLQSMIDSDDDGYVRAPACIYRETVRITKPLVLEAEPGAEIRGSDIWTGWERQSDGTWRSNRQIFDRYLGDNVHYTNFRCTFEDDANGLPKNFRNTLPTNQTDVEGQPGHGESGYLQCKWAEQIFVDGRELRQVASDQRPGPGEFKATIGSPRGKNRHIILGEDPRGRKVEVSVRDQWIAGHGNGHNVTIKGFRMRHAGNRIGIAALAVNYRRNWKIENNTLSHTASEVVAVSGPNAKLINNDIFCGGISGAGAVGTNNGAIEIKNNRIHRNNTERAWPAWGAAGMKVVRTERGFVIDNNDVYLNNANGIWCDIDCNDTEITNNRVYNNSRNGIYYEISRNGTIRDNWVWLNGWRWRYGAAGIMVSTSHNMDISDNKLIWNKFGVQAYTRSSWGNSSIDGTPWRADNIRIRNNRIFMGGGASDKAIEFRSYGDRRVTNSYAEDGNLFWYPGGKHRFRWVDNSIYVHEHDFSNAQGRDAGNVVQEEERRAIIRRGPDSIAEDPPGYLP